MTKTISSACEIVQRMVEYMRLHLNYHVIKQMIRPCICSYVNPVIYIHLRSRISCLKVVSSDQLSSRYSALAWRLRGANPHMSCGAQAPWPQYRINTYLKLLHFHLHNGDSSTVTRSCSQTWNGRTRMHSRKSRAVIGQEIRKGNTLM